MRTLTNRLVLAITCIMLISSMPVVLAATSLGGTSATAQQGGGLISGTSQVTGSDLEQLGESDDTDVGGVRTLSASIQSEVEVPEGQTGSAQVDFDVPKSSQSTQSVSGSDYKLTVSADGITSASVEKTSTSGVAYSLARIYAEATADYAPQTEVDGMAEIWSRGLLTGTGSISSRADGFASFDAEMVPASGDGDIVTSGSVEGSTTIDAENVKGGSVIGMMVPAVAALIINAGADDDYAYAGHTSGVILMGERDITASPGTTSAIANVSGASKGSASTPLSSAAVGCNEPITSDLTGTISATARGDRAIAYTVLAVEADSEDASWVDADANLFVISAVQRIATCCDNGEIALATSQIVDAAWDAVAITDDGQGGVWQACIDGATGMTRDGSTVPTEPGYAAGATSLNRKGTLQSNIMTYQHAEVDAGVPTTDSFSNMMLSGPDYTPTSSIEDAAGARFAVDYMDMIASSGTGDGETLETNIAGPDAFLWITGDNSQTLNGHFASEGYSIYDAAFDPPGSGDIAGPDLTVQSTIIPRRVQLIYGTTQA